MATDGGADADRARVQTYVPAYQKEAWAADADEFDMSLSEFVRSMVQAGRRGFSTDPPENDDPSLEDSAATPSSDRDPGGTPLEDRVVAILSEDACHDWDELVEELTDDVEDRLEDALQQLQADDRVRYSGRNGGYTLE